jgi:SEC-C motif-containing protein
MAGVGRNERCPCGSGRKVKRCCGVQRGPSEDELAKAFLAVEARAAAWVLRDHDDEQLDELHDALIDLPSVDPSLLWPLPRLLTPELARLGAALADQDEDTEAVWGLLQGVLARLDTPRARAGLARAVLALRAGGRLDQELAAVAVIDLASPSTTLVRVSLLQAVAVDAGAVPTASGLVVARR